MGICAHSISPNKDYIKRKKQPFRIAFEWELTDSNRRPSACKADALNQLS